MFLLFYNLALLTGLIAGAPWWLWRLATTRKYREGLAARLGKVPAWLRSQAPARPVIWLHAVSVGEVLAVSRLIEGLDRALPDMQVLISTTTRTGHKLARERFGENRVFYCPLDLPWAVSAYFDAIKPRMLVLAETEFWPNLLNACFHRQIPVAVVNARISDRSWPRYRLLRWFWRPQLGRLSRVLAQSAADAERLIALGCVSERVSVAGNLKFDVRAVQEAEATRLLKSLGHGLRYIVAGSTLEGEEAVLLEAWPKLLAADQGPTSGLAMVLAPRHPERFGTVAELLRNSGFHWSERSFWKDRPVEQLEPIKAGQIVLLDTIGELASVYSIATVAFVGGSLFAMGGHNPLEPAQFGAPIVMGPHYANFRAITEDLIAHDAVRIASKEELEAALIDLLSNQAKAAAIGERAKRIFAAQAGATERALHAIQELLAKAGRAA
jgi:3-deoxy-D-manno-octulosonic-acid transferase